MRIGVALAVYVTNEIHFDLARQTLATITSEKYSISTCSWLNHPIRDEWRFPFEDRGLLHDNDENNVSRAWNRAIHHLLTDDCDVVFVPNLDIVLQPGALDRLADTFQTNPGPILRTMSPWHYLEPELGLFDEKIPGIAGAPIVEAYQPHPHFSAFMVDRRLFERVGPFDERFVPAYNEDIDMHWRIQLAGEEAVQYEGARFFHHGSATIRNDKKLRKANAKTHGENDDYFAEKWGFKPATADEAFTEEMYRFPFNDPAMAGIERNSHRRW